LRTWTGSVSASADLATGKLGASASAFNGDAGTIVVARAGAGVIDTLMFHLPQGVRSKEITLTMDVTATLPIHPNVLANVFMGDASLYFGDGADTLFWDLTSSPGLFRHVLSVTATVEDGVPIDVLGKIEGDLTVQRFSPTDPGYPFDPGNDTFTWDARHTAALSISLPPGVTYESLSGVFLSQAPEPSALQLLLLAVPAIAAAPRLRRARSRAS